MSMAHASMCRYSSSHFVNTVNPFPANSQIFAKKKWERKYKQTAYTIYF